MGLWLFLFNQAGWNSLYGKCLLRTKDEWNADGTPNLILGLIYVILGVVFEVVYIPFLIVMSRKEFIKYPCYKLMFLLGLIDVIQIPCCAIITGIQCARGAHFCTNPIFYYLVGCISTSLWYGCAMTCNILAINRFFEICFPRIAEKIFGRQLVYLWLAIPIIVILYSFTERPAVYSIVHHTVYFDPYAGSANFESQAFNNIFQLINNIMVIVFMTGFYSTMCIIWIIRSKIIKLEKVTKFQLLLTIQSMCICIEILLSTMLYTYMQYFPISDVFVVVAHIFWICIHGDTPIVYMTFNESLRKAVRKTFFSFKFKYTNSVAVAQQRMISRAQE